MKKQLINLAVLLPFLTLSLTSCERYRCIKGDGPVTTETRTLNAFDEVEIDLAADVEVVFDKTLSSPSVKIKAREDVIERIETEVSVGALYIDSRRCISSKSPVEIILYVNDLERLDLDGSGNIHGNTTIESDHFETNIKGSGNINLMAEANEVSTKVSGSGNITLDGEATTFIAKVSGSGDINANGLITQSADVKVSGSGNIKTNVSQSLNVKISGSGNVYYSGNPSLNVSITGSGDVVKY